MAHHAEPNGDTYVDTDFVTSAQRVPGVTLQHMGFGEFYFETPKGRVEVDRMRGKDFEGQIGRSHKLYDDQRGTGAAEWLVEQAERLGRSERVASEARLRERIVRLAHATPSLRPLLLPLVAEAHERRVADQGPAVWNEGRWVQGTRWQPEGAVAGKNGWGWYDRERLIHFNLFPRTSPIGDDAYSMSLTAGPHEYEWAGPDSSMTLLTMAAKHAYHHLLRGVEPKAPWKFRRKTPDWVLRDIANAPTEEEATADMESWFRTFTGSAHPHVGQRVRARKDHYAKPSDGRYAEWIDAGTEGKVVDEGEDEDGAFYFVTVTVTPGRFADDPTPYGRTYTVNADVFAENWR